MARKKRRSFKSLPKRARRAAFAKMQRAGKLRAKNGKGRRVARATGPR